jgi:hypothetical protein
MSRFKRPVLWAALAAIILLACLSVYGAFLGADRAQVFFNSVPAVVYWHALVALLIAGLALFRRLLRVPALLLMHAGCILILAGGMWGSPGAQRLRGRLLGHERIRKGQMVIFEGMTENSVRIGDSDDVPRLPFSIRLKDFRIEYYRPGTLMMQSRSGQTWRMPAEAGQSLSLGGDLGKVTIQRTFEASGSNGPALEVTQENPDGSTGRRSVFLEQPTHMNPNADLIVMYRRGGVRDYVSELEVVEEGNVVKQKDIEVNHPLYYAGYHFYQSSYGQNQFGEYTVLTVVSDAGLKAVFAGYALLVLGVCWQFWFRRLWPATRIGGHNADDGNQKTKQGGGGHGH